MNPSDSKNPPAGQREAATTHPLTGGEQPTTNRANEPHAGDHMAQYGMRSTQAVGGAESANDAPQEINGVEAFDDEYSAREARDRRARTLPTGADDPSDALGTHRPKRRE